jgi:methionyl-tRNA synthetase
MIDPVDIDRIIHTSCGTSNLKCPNCGGTEFTSGVCDNCEHDIFIDSLEHKRTTCNGNPTS